jgi:hypothetical protein
LDIGFLGGKSWRVGRVATEAYRQLLAIESGDLSAIISMLRATLLGPLEPWRRFELAVGLALSEALATAQSKPLTLNLLIGDNRRSLARCGKFAVYWQWRTDYYDPPEPEPSEVVERRILDVYGISYGSDRPDLVIVDQDQDEVAAIVEVKYLTGDDAMDRVKGAISQLVRYARGYVAAGDLDRLLGRSLTVTSQGIATLPHSSMAEGIPAAVDFAGIKAEALAPWAARLCGHLMSD